MNTLDAIAFFGTASNLADALDIEKSAVSQWKDRPPIGRQAQIQILTKGKLKADPITPKQKKSAA